MIPHICLSLSGLSSLCLTGEETEAQRDHAVSLDSLSWEGVDLDSKPTSSESQASVYASQLLALSRDVRSPASPAHV